MCCTIKPGLKGFPAWDLAGWRASWLTGGRAVVVCVLGDVLLLIFFIHDISILCSSKLSPTGPPFVSPSIRPSCRPSHGSPHSHLNVWKLWWWSDRFCVLFCTSHTVRLLCLLCLLCCESPRGLSVPFSISRSSLDINTHTHIPCAVEHLWINNMYAFIFVRYYTVSLVIVVVVVVVPSPHLGRGQRKLNWNDNNNSGQSRANTNILA